MNINPTICFGDTIYLLSNRFIYYLLTNLVGCDTLDLRVVSPTNLVYNICAGDSIQVGSNVYYFSLVSVNGCDSVINTQISWVTDAQIL